MSIWLGRPHHAACPSMWGCVQKGICKGYLLVRWLRWDYRRSKYLHASLRSFQLTHQAQKLIQAFKLFGYEVEVIALPYVGSLVPFLELITLEPSGLCAHDLQMWCYVGGTRVLNTNYDDLTSVPNWEMKNGGQPDDWGVLGSSAFLADTFILLYKAWTLADQQHAHSTGFPILHSKHKIRIP